MAFWFFLTDSKGLEFCKCQLICKRYLSGIFSELSVNKDRGKAFLNCQVIVL